MIMNKFFIVTIHVVAGMLMMAVCWMVVFVGDISVWRKLFCSIVIALSTIGVSNTDLDVACFKL